MKYITSFTVFMVIVLISATLAVSQVSPSSGKAMTLFDFSTSKQKQAVSVQDSVIIQKQAISLNEAIYQENTISEVDIIVLPLFSGETINAEITSVSTNVRGTTSVTGKIPGEIPGNIIITYKDKRLFGTLKLYDQNRHFNIKSDSKKKEHYLVEKDIKAMEPFKCGGAITVSEDRDLK